MLEQVAVVGRHFDDETVRVEAEGIHGLVDKLSGVLDPRGGVGGVVGVVAAEGVLRCDEGRNLQQQAVGAQPEAKWVGRLGKVELFLG